MMKIKKKIPKSVQIILAWLSILLIALISIFLAALIASLFLPEVESSIATTKSLAVFGLIGLQLLSVLALILRKLRGRAYIRHVLIGLWIGVGIYSLFFAGGAALYIVENNQSEVSGDICTSPTDVYKSKGSAIVPIATELGIGSGVIIDDIGTVLTAYHVIEDAKEVYASYSSGKVNMRIIDKAPQYDLALLRLEKSEKVYFPLAGNYSTSDEVMAYGYPYNALSAGPPSVTDGIVSRVLTTSDLRMTESSAPDGLEIIQTDAAINPGNSGGALIGSCGVIGIVVATSDSAELSEYVGAVSEQGISYAVSSKTAAKAFKLTLVQP